MMMMKSVFWWRKSEYPEETSDLRQVTDDTFYTNGLCPVRGLNLGRSGVKQSELRRDESGALAHRATAVVCEMMMMWMMMMWMMLHWWRKPEHLEETTDFDVTEVTYGK